MTKSELIEILSQRQVHLKADDVDLAVKSLLEMMGGALADGERIEVRGFGSFSLHFRPPRTGRNPKTGDAVALAGKHVPHFKPGKELRERVSGVIPLDGDRTLYNAVLPIELFHFDRLVHAFGFGFATLACGKVLLRLVAGPPAAVAVLAVLAGLGVGALNEIVEFIATLVLPDTNVGGYVNTGWDLIFDLLGGIVAMAWLLRRPARLAR